MLLRYFLYDFEMAPVSPIITGITFISTLHLPYISIVKIFTFQNLLAHFLITYYYYYYYYSVSVIGHLAVDLCLYVVLFV
jgi:hypothetical protein